jgi:hypothetical protein
MYNRVSINTRIPTLPGPLTNAQRAKWGKTKCGQPDADDSTFNGVNNNGHRSEGCFTKGEPADSPPVSKPGSGINAHHGNLRLDKKAQDR